MRDRDLPKVSTRQARKQASFYREKTVKQQRGVNTIDVLFRDGGNFSSYDAN